MRKTLIAIAVAACLAGCDSGFWLKDAGQEEIGKTKQEAPAPPPLRIGDFVHVNSKTVACRSRDTLIQLQEFLGKDLAAFDSLWANSLRAASAPICFLVAQVIQNEGKAASVLCGRRR